MRKYYNRETGYYKDKKLSQADIADIELLLFQEKNQFLSFFIQLLLYNANNKSIELILRKYEDKTEDIQFFNVDNMVLKALLIGLVINFNYLYLAVNRYNILKTRFKDNEDNPVISPNKDFLIGSIFNVFGGYYLLKGAKGFFDMSVNNSQNNSEENEESEIPII